MTSTGTLVLLVLYLTCSFPRFFHFPYMVFICFWITYLYLSFVYLYCRYTLLEHPGGTVALADIEIVLLKESEPPIVAEMSLCSTCFGITVDADIE